MRLSRHLQLKLLHALWPACIARARREAVKASLRSIHVSDRKVLKPKDFEDDTALRQRLRDTKDTPTFETSPLDAWAFVRVHNEVRTLGVALETIAGVFKRGILAHHGSTDGSVEIMEAFCQKHPGFSVFHYPHSIYPAHHDAYKGEVPEENTLAGYYNAILEKIPEGDWFMKIDADHAYHSDALRFALYLPLHETDAVSLSRVNMVVKNEGKNDDDFQVMSFLDHYDQWLVCKRNLEFKMVTGIKPDGDYYAYELLELDRNFLKMECPQLHFPYEKSWRAAPEGDFEPFTDFMAKQSKARFDPDFFNLENVKRLYRRFV